MMPLPPIIYLDDVAKAIFFAGGSEWSITPYHVNEKTRELAESWWENPPNQELRDRKELAYLQAEAAMRICCSEMAPIKRVAL